MISVKYGEVEDEPSRQELIKMELRSFIIPFSENKARGTRLCFENSEKKLAEFDITILNHSGIF